VDGGRGARPCPAHARTCHVGGLHHPSVARPANVLLTYPMPISWPGIPPSAENAAWQHKSRSLGSPTATGRPYSRGSMCNKPRNASTAAAFTICIRAAAASSASRQRRRHRRRYIYIYIHVTATSHSSPTSPLPAVLYL